MSAPPRTPARQSCAITRLWSASPTTRTCSTQTGRRRLTCGADRDQRHAAVEYTDAVRKQRRELARAERVERRRRSRVRGRRGRAQRGGSQCTNGSSVCTSIGKNRFGVVTKTRRATRRARGRTCRCPSRPPSTCSTTAFEKPRSNSPSRERQPRPSARTARTCGERRTEPVELGVADGRDPLRPRVARLEEVVGRAVAERRVGDADVDDGRLRARAEATRGRGAASARGSAARSARRDAAPSARGYCRCLDIAACDVDGGAPAAAARTPLRLSGRLAERPDPRRSTGELRRHVARRRASSSACRRVQRTGRARIVVAARQSDAGVEHVRFVLGLDDDHSEFLRRFADDPLIGEATPPPARPAAAAHATVAHALLRAVAGQLIQARRARQIEANVIRRRRPRAHGLHAPPTVDAELGTPVAGRAGAARARRPAGDRRSSGSAARSTWSRSSTSRPSRSRARLEREPGLGPWSIGVVCLQGLGRYERGLARDLGLVKLVSQLRGRRAEPEETDELLAPYGEWAGLASVYLLAVVPRAVTYAFPMRGVDCLSCTSATITRPSVGELLAGQARAGRLDRPDRGHHARTGLPRAAAAAEPDWRQRHPVVGRRALRAARRRALELPAREGEPARPARACRRTRCTGSAASCSRRTRRASSTMRSTESSSTCSCSGSGPDGHMASLFPGSPQLDVENRRAIERACGPRAVGRPGDDDAADAPLGAAGSSSSSTGADKADAVARAFAGEISREVPASLLRLAPVPVEVWSDDGRGGEDRRMKSLGRARVDPERCPATSTGRSS